MLRVLITEIGCLKLEKNVLEMENNAVLES